MRCLIILMVGYASGALVMIDRSFGVVWCIAFIMMCCAGWMAGKCDRQLRDAH